MNTDVKPSRRKEFIIRMVIQIICSYLLGYYYHLCPPWGDYPFQGWKWWQGLTFCWVTSAYVALWINNLNRWL